MKSVQQKILFTEAAPRIELLVRIPWGILSGIVLWFFLIVVWFALAINFLHILFLGKRHKGLTDITKAVEVQQFRLALYLSFVTDERPPIVPELNV